LIRTKTAGIALSALAREIDAEHRQVEAATLSAILHARNAGQLLLEAKARLRHGAWLPWLAANCDVKERQARNYMRIAERWELISNRQRAADLTVRGALELMGAITSQLARETDCREQDEADIGSLGGEDRLYCGDCLEVMRGMPADSVDLVFGSPPYEDSRTYGIDYDLTDDAWVDWMFARCCESLRVCRGLVAFVVEGRTNNYRWSATPVLLMQVSSCGSPSSTIVRVRRGQGDQIGCGTITNMWSASRNADVSRGQTPRRAARCPSGVTKEATDHDGGMAHSRTATGTPSRSESTLATW
jgi:hypothetical protein